MVFFSGGKMKTIIITLLYSSFIFAATDSFFITNTIFVEQSQRDPISNSVTNKFGALKVKLGSNLYDQTKKPWSSWWFPSRERYIFDREGTLSPLEKYDRVHQRAYGRNPYTTNYERDEVYNDNAATWSGLCHAWAIASVKHKEPASEKNIRGYQFSVGDQKALLLKSYENVSGLKIHGQRFNGTARDLYEDMYPDQLHKFVEVFLRDKKKAFLMDYDASYPVWTVPVYKAKSVVEALSSTKVKVSLWLTYASSFVDTPNYVGTKSISKVYRYNLTGKYQGDTFIVSGGEWIDESIEDHPDYTIEYPENVNRSTFNKNLKIPTLDTLFDF